MDDDAMSNVEIDKKTGKPTKAAMKRAFEEDKELFMDLQEKYFTTKGTMGDSSLLDQIKKLIEKR